jgi:hypothetical protein
MPRRRNRKSVALFGPRFTNKKKIDGKRRPGFDDKQLRHSTPTSSIRNDEQRQFSKLKKSSGPFRLNAQLHRTCLFSLRHGKR